MKSTKIPTNVQKALDALIAQYPLMMQIVRAIDERHGRVLLVGGAVRDLFMCLPVKDVDVEVHGLTESELESLLGQFGPVRLIGKIFGVLYLNGLDVDWALPRSDAPGRKPKVTIDPNMAFEMAFRRRDLTINAMGIDLITHELIDPFGGLEDLANKVLRAPDAQLFAEDPLRFYRVMQFISRFEMQPDAALNEVCRHIDISGVSLERIEKEFEKMLLKSKRPSLGTRWLKDIGRLASVLPELAATIGIEQNSHWHPEGDVFEHTMQTVDAVAAVACDSDETKLILFYAALCHDLGKVITTENDEEGISSHGHESEGIVPTKKMLSRITEKKELIKAVSVLVRHHMAPGNFVAGNAKPAAYKRLAAKLSPYATLQMLGMLALADKRARNPKRGIPLTGAVPEVDEFLRQANALQVLEHREEPVLHGRDLLDQIEPGPQLGVLVAKAYEIQIEEGITDKEVLKQRVLATLKKS